MARDLGLAALARMVLHRHLGNAQSFLDGARLHLDIPAKPTIP
jgi:hypothetical protein